MVKSTNIQDRNHDPYFQIKVQETLAGRRIKSPFLVRTLSLKLQRRHRTPNAKEG
jgi:hypothetical protein